MVKIREGYVMSAREQQEYDRVNALPRKASGSVAYYYKPQTKYPARIYVFMHAEMWQDRNRRPMGLFHALPFLTRPMNREEIEYHHFDTRLCYYQYEDFDRLLQAENREAAQLDLERPSSGSDFLEKLRSFRSRYPVGATAPLKSFQDENGQFDADAFLFSRLFQLANNYTAEEIGDMLEKEYKQLKRLPMLVLLKAMYKNAGDGKPPAWRLDEKRLKRKIEIAEKRRRLNFVRRTYQANPLFAMQEIGLRYPDYDEAMLHRDLVKKPGKIKHKKHKPVVDHRRCQMDKLSKLLETAANEQAYHQTCNKLAILEQAHRQRLPIPLLVNYGGDKKVYYFHWQTRENVIKHFAEQANRSGMDHKKLGKLHQEVTSSGYSY